jgi:pyruvate kinase
MNSRRAKIIATLGPSSNTVESISKLIKAGMNCARVNMSHGTHEGQKQLIENIREASKKIEREVAVLLDLQGPKIRVDKVDKPLELKKGETWYIGTSALASQYKNNFIPTVYENLVDDCHEGATILFDDGNLEAKAIKKDGDVLQVEVIEGGLLKSNKGINLPNVNVSAPSFTDKDEKDLLFGLENNVDYVALSFVRTADDIIKVQNFIKAKGHDTPLIAKIEKPEALENIDEIIHHANMIMIARGDMGVEIGNHLVPSIQKELILKCNQVGRPVITATQMLESMITSSRPTRAEANDVANAIWDGTDVVMLSGETASGDYPVQAVKMMSQIISEAEKTPKDRPLLRHQKLIGVTQTMQVAASLVAEKIEAKWIISVTQTGRSCFKMTRFRPGTNVLGVTKSVQAVRRMCLYWGISPFMMDEEGDVANMEMKMIDHLKKLKLVEKGDKVVVTHGRGQFFSEGATNLVRVEEITG